MAKHTPGPWRDGNTADSVVADLPEGIEPDDNSRFYGGYCVAESVSSNNKPLIKAAPELLRLFRKLDEKLPNDWALPSGACDVLAELRAAADAAEGKLA